MMYSKLGQQAHEGKLPMRSCSDFDFLSHGVHCHTCKSTKQHMLLYAEKLLARQDTKLLEGCMRPHAPDP